MIRATLDTNVLAPGIAGAGSLSNRLFRLWREGAFVLVISDHILQELERALNDSYFAARVPRSTVAEAMRQLSVYATVIDLTINVCGVATHPEDDLVLSTALSGNASVLCTRDKQLLKLGNFDGIDILSPGELLARIEAG
ncbi:MAG: putative toxin-antitoxin system toxin component, PIN family [Thermomicrobiales bacterium]